MNDSIEALLAQIRPADAEAMRRAEERQARLAKPPGSLGQLEALSVRLAGVTGVPGSPVDHRRVLVFAADNGVAAEGVSSAPKSVTAAQTVNIALGKTGVGVLARHFAAEVEVIDVGVDADIECAAVRGEKVARGTRNIAVEPAMTRAQARQAFMIGARAAQRAKQDGVQIIGVGAMGIGNTTTSAAVLSALTGRPAAETAGRGGGVNDAGFAHKTEIIDTAILRFKPDPGDPLDALSKVGGFDLCAMTGAFVSAAALKLPVVIDGFISAVAALCAYRLNPLCRDAMFPSHCSAEKGYRLAMDELGLEPLLNLNMRLGEGSGCPIAFELISAAADVLNHMATFEEAAIDDGYLAEIRRNRRFTEDA